uniref:Replication protein A 70 kDa DNA-binding subunit B/D first OB fold domain-containing protein n=1 Tax=Brassica oleracea TaxID=3712 RepID=A0A3P6G1V5_BRAOL|nr:unnamed protein product [Brassica oleracea]
MVTSDRITLLNDVKPFKSTWKVEVKVLHSWTQRSNYPGGDSLQFILADKTVSGVKIHCTCKRLFLARVKKLQVGQWRFIENVSVTPAAGKYRPTSHAYKLTIISNSNVTNSSLKNDDEFLSLTTFPEIMNGSLDSNVLIAIDIGDMQVVPVQGKETKKLELTLTDTEFKIHLLLKDDTGETKVMLLDTVAEPILGVSAEVLLNGSLEEVEDPEDLPDQVTALIGKTFKFGVYVNKDNVDYGSHIFNVGKTWSADTIITRADDEDTGDTSTIVSSDRSSGQVSFVSIESEDNTCLSSTPLSKRKGSSNEIDDLSSTSKKQCSKIIKVEKNTVEK